MSELTILIPLDGSKPAELALAFLRALEPLGEARVRLLSVAESDRSLPVEEENRRERLTGQYLDGVKARIDSSEGLSVECVRRTGTPYVEILDEADSQDVNLILMTTHGRTASEPERLGGVADKVVRGASCPTLLVGPHASVPLQIQRITVPLDGSGLAAEALPVAKALAERLSCGLRLVRAVHYPPIDPDSVGGLAADVIGSMERVAELYLSEAKLELETDRPVETAVLSGPPVEALMSDVREHPPELVVMTSHGHTGFIRWALGSVTDRLIRGPVPVLVLRPFDEVGDRLKPLTEG